MINLESDVGDRGGEAREDLIERYTLLGEKLRVAFGTTVDNGEPNLEKALEVFYRSLFNPEDVQRNGVDDNDSRFSDRISILGKKMNIVLDFGVEKRDFVKVIRDLVLNIDLQDDVVDGALNLINELNKLGCNWGIWSGGDVAWQLAKISQCGLFPKENPKLWIHPLKQNTFGDEMEIGSYDRVALVEDMPKYLDEAYEIMGDKAIYFRVTVGRHGGHGRKECKSDVKPTEIINLDDVVHKIAKEGFGEKDLVVLDFDGVLVNDSTRWVKTAAIIDKEMKRRGWSK